MHAVIQSRMQTISMIGSCRELQWNTQRKARLRAVLQITSAQQHVPIHFILPRLKLNRTGGSTHWRRKYKTCSIRSTKSHRLTTRIRCGHNKQSEATRSTFARLCSSADVSQGSSPLLLEYDSLTRTASPGASFGPKRTSTLGSLNESTMSTRLHTAWQVKAVHWCATTPTNFLHKLTN